MNLETREEGGCFSFKSGESKRDDPTSFTASEMDVSEDKENMGDHDMTLVT